jgi:hypothetical protein
VLSRLDSPNRCEYLETQSRNHVVKARIVEANTPLSWIEDDLPSDWAEEQGPLQNAVHGEILHQEELESFAASGRSVAVLLRREPTNPVDPLACLAMVEGVEVGHLDRYVAEFFAPTLDEAGITEWWVSGEIVGGYPTAESLGVHLWLGRRLSPGPDWPFWKL